MGAGELILRTILAAVSVIVAAILTVGVAVTATVAVRMLTAFVVQAVHLRVTVRTVIREPSPDWPS